MPNQLNKNASHVQRSHHRGVRPVQNLRRVSRLALSFALATGFGFAVCAAFSQNDTAQKVKEVVSPVPTVAVTVIVDNDTRTATTPATTVGELFAAEKIVLGKLDRCNVPLTMPITPDMAPLVVTRVTVATEKETVELPFTTKKQLTHRLRVGQSKTIRAGKAGAKTVTYRVVTKDGETTRTKVAETVKKPVDAVVLTGMRGATIRMLASRGALAGARVITMRASGYGPGDNGSWGNITATGMRPGFGIVAVDPRFIRLGTRLYVEGYGYAIAGDTGGAIKGNRIDLGFNTRHEAMAVGRRNVRVLVLR